MPTIRSLLSPLSAAVLALAAFDAASAQTVVATATVRPAARATDAVAAPRQRALAIYQLDGTQQGVPAQVTVADSAGKLVASYRTRGGRTEHPMTIEVADSDILLQAQTSRGMLTLVLYQQNDPDAAGPFVGAWSLGSRQGELRGRAER